MGIRDVVLIIAAILIMGIVGKFFLQSEGPSAMSGKVGERDKIVAKKKNIRKLLNSLFSTENKEEIKDLLERIAFQLPPYVGSLSYEGETVPNPNSAAASEHWQIKDLQRYIYTL